jgi:DNA-binding transcriptional LysR family regulator
MLDFDLLRAFVAVADCGGFHRAAERLNLTQSTISQQIKRLEFETKRPLFRRTTRSVGLTNDGQMLLGDARRLLRLEEVARYCLVAPRLSGRVRLGVVAEVAGGSMPSALGRFATLHPTVKLTVRGETRVLGPGDAYRFDSRLPHRFRNIGTEDCVIISAATPLTF